MRISVRRLLSVVFTFGIVFGFIAFAQRQQSVTVRMTWEIGPPFNPRTNAREAHILLRFKRNPNYFVGIYSDRVARYLRTLPHKEADVTFDVWRAFGLGRVRSFSISRICNLEFTDGDFYAGLELPAESTDGGPEPWP